MWKLYIQWGRKKSINVCKHVVEIYTIYLSLTRLQFYIFICIVHFYCWFVHLFVSISIRTKWHFGMFGYWWWTSLPSIPQLYQWRIVLIVWDSQCIGESFWLAACYWNTFGHKVESSARVSKYKNWVVIDRYWLIGVKLP